MLKWRRDVNVDKIRNNILYGGMDHPTKFPYADVIMKHAYQIVIAIDALDRSGNPISLETFNFEPKDVMKIISTDQYLEFLAYTLEYKSLVIEQLSDERERNFLAEWNNNPPYTPEGYGVIVKINIIRDLHGFGRRHMTADAKKVIGEGLKIGVNHYNEFMSRGIMTNTPFLFNALWLFVKMFLDAKTIAKILMLSSSYMSQLLEEMPLESIPERLGGKYKGDNEFIKLNTEVGGIYYRLDTIDVNNSMEKPNESHDVLIRDLSIQHSLVNSDAHNKPHSNITNSHLNSDSISRYVHDNARDDKKSDNYRACNDSTNSNDVPGKKFTRFGAVFNFVCNQGFAMVGIVLFSILFLHFDSDTSKLLVLPFLMYFMVKVLV